MSLNYYLARLAGEDAILLKSLEDTVQLAFWGEDNYRRMLGELPEYFGCKAVGAGGGVTDRLIGFFLARAIYENLELLKLGVLPEWHRMGVGSQLLENAVAEGMRRGCNRCFLEVRKSNQNAIQFYYNHSFRIAGTRLNYYSEPVEDAWVMEKSI